MSPEEKAKRDARTGGISNIGSMTTEEFERYKSAYEAELAKRK